MAKPRAAGFASIRATPSSRAASRDRRPSPAIPTRACRGGRRQTGTLKMPIGGASSVTPDQTTSSSGSRTAWSCRRRRRKAPSRSRSSPSSSSRRSARCWRNSASPATPRRRRPDCGSTRASDSRGRQVRAGGRAGRAGEEHPPRCDSPQRYAADAEGRHAPHREPTSSTSSPGSRTAPTGRWRYSRRKTYTTDAEAAVVGAAAGARWDPDGQGRGLAAQRHRPVRAGQAREGRADAGPHGRRAHAAAPRHLRPDWPDAEPTRRSRPSRPTARRTPTRRSSTGCSRRRSTARSGRATGWTWSATAKTITTSAAAAIAPRSIPSPISIATG